MTDPDEAVRPSESERSEDDRFLSTRIPDLRNVSFKDLQRVVREAKETPLGSAVEKLIDESDGPETVVIAGWNSRISRD